MHQGKEHTDLQIPLPFGLKIPSLGFRAETGALMATAKARNYPNVHQQGATDRSIYSMGYFAGEKECGSGQWDIIQ